MASSASTVSFSEGPLFRQLLSFALPLMAVNILQYVYQAVDMAVVGQVVGDVGLVSMSNAVNAVFLVNAFVIGLSAGGGVVVARAVGAGKAAGAAVWMAGHGLCCWGPSLADALCMSEELEHLAAVQLLALGAR